MNDFLFDLAVPRTDAAVFVQGILALVVFAVALWRSRLLSALSTALRNYSRVRAITDALNTSD